MKYLYKHKTKINYILFIVAFIFKFAVIQEYVHIEQHNKEHSHHIDCQVCHNIYLISKYQAFEIPEIFDFALFKHSIQLHLFTCAYSNIFFKNIISSELYNRPPPQGV